MAKKRKKKHVPQRTCVGCRAVQSKKSLIRIVRTEDGVQIDLTGKLPGRGAYLHNKYSCWEQGLKGALAKSLKTKTHPEDHERLTQYMHSLRDDEMNNSNL